MASPGTAGCAEVQVLAVELVHAVLAPVIDDEVAAQQFRDGAHADLRVSHDELQMYWPTCHFDVLIG